MSITQQQRLDNATMGAFLRDLQHRESEIDRVEFPNLPFAEGKLVPIQNIPDPYATDTLYTQVTRVGSFKLIRNYTTDLPKVDVLMREFKQPILKFGSAYTFNEEDVGSFAKSGISIQTEKIAAVMEAAKQKMNRLIAFGKPEAGMNGFLNHPDCFRSEAAFAINNTTTSQEQLSVLNDAVNFIPERTNQIELPDTILLPLSVRNYLANLPYTVSGTGLLSKTVLQHFMESNAYIKNVMGLNELEADYLAAQGLPARPAMVVYNRNISKLKVKVFKPVGFHEPLRIGSLGGWERAATFKMAGVELRRPYSMQIVELPQAA